MSFYRTLVVSDHWFASAARRCYRTVEQFSVPAPRIICVPFLWIVITLTYLWYFLYRVLVCEPLFKACCRSFGKNLHTGAHLHKIEGKGELILGDNVLIDGRCGFMFAALFSEAPTVSIGDNTGIGHNCYFIVGKRITIGKNCRISGHVRLFDSPGHPLDPEKRQAGFPPDLDSVRPITIGHNVWLGTGAVIFPGVTIGDNSVVSVQAVVMSDVPSNVLVAGNPARKILSLEPIRGGSAKV
jgi:acetyltransferase-like isoleucine patch superfamily enzyme